MVLQMEATECGAASLSIILQFYSKYVPLTTLRELCGVSRDGTNAANILKAAQSLGLIAKGYKWPIEKLKALNQPCIIFWEFNHFLVVEEFRDDYVILNDPAIGHREISFSEFDASYTGIALTFSPTDNFIADGTPPSLWPIVFRRISSEGWASIFLLFTGFLLVIPQLILPVFLQIYVDDVLGNQFSHWLKPLLWFMGLTIVVHLFLQTLSSLSRKSLQLRLTRRFSVDFQQKMISLPENFYIQRFAGDIAIRIDYNKEIAEFIATRFIPFVSSTFLLVFYLILTLLYSWMLGLIVFVTTGINALIVSFSFRYFKDMGQQVSKDSGKAAAVVVTALQQIESVKSAAIEQNIFTRFSGYQARVLNTTQKVAINMLTLNMIPEFLATINEIMVLSIGFLLVMKGDLTLGMLLAAQSIVLNLRVESDKFIAFFRDLPAFSANLMRLEDVLEQPSDLLLTSDKNAQIAYENGKLSGSIVLNNVCYSHSPLDPYFINNLNLEIRPGERIALVGASGSGKSTIAKLISGIKNPSSGRILFDGNPLKNIPRHIVSRSLSMVEQNVVLFGCSVKDNITLWNDSISMRKIRQACADAQILETISRLPGSFDHIIKEGGSSLSGGQKQRLDIARAFCTDPTILILDEATSALDAESESLVSAEIKHRGCTQIIVAHRLSTVRDCDKIYVIEKGSVVQSGTHLDMIEQTSSPYYKLINSSS